MVFAFRPSPVSTKWALVFVAATLIQHIFAAEVNLRRWKRQSCSSREFQCDSGQCIGQFDICDGIVNCDDGSDETAKTCQRITCPSYAFRCAYGACVNSNAKCNGKKECVDGSDENGCPSTTGPSHNPCKKNNFRCKSGTCIDNFLICDGTQDCDDGSDETTETCSGFTCPGFAFRCDYGACIDRSGVCNGVKQCADGSDENESRCGPSTTTTTTTTQAPTAGCKLPPQPENGQYKLGGCNPPACQPVPGNTVHNTFISYACNPGFALSGRENLLCDGGWSSPFPTCSRTSCPPLVNPSREIECKLNDKKVECDQPMAPGTKAFVQCNRYYTQVKEFSDFDTICQPNGKWTRDITSCIPKCGEPNPQGVTFVAGGIEAKYGEFPWHAGIYRLIDEKFQQVCGGSIISEQVIVTAAHCFWNVHAGKQFDTEQMRVVVGKFYRDWNNKEERYIQMPEIKKLILQERFRGDQRLWQDDIALIILNVKIQLTVAVRPICVDYKKDNDKFFLPGKKGIVVGWGISETMKQSETLLTATLPYVGFEDCEKEVPQSFSQFLTNDKFCAGYRNGTSVCPGDSGGGYATQFRDGKWYLMGLVSVGVPSNSSADACNIYQYTTFTKVSMYYDFLQNNNSK